MKTLPRIYSLLVFLMLSTLVVFAQEKKSIDDILPETKLKGINYDPTQHNALEIPLQQRSLQELRSRMDDYRNESASVNDRFDLSIHAAASDSAWVYLWDTDWELGYRIYYYFNALSIDILQEKLLPGGDWENYSQRVLEYYSNGRFRSETESYWKTSESSWKTAYYEAYNEAGVNTEVYSKLWNDTTEEFTEGARLVSTYKKDTLLDVELEQEWDLETKGWKNLSRLQNTYTPNDLLSGRLFSVNGEGGWENDYKIAYEFNAFGDLISQSSQVWDTVNLEWVNDVRISRSYNTIGNVTGILREQWDTLTEAWVNELNRIIDYNDAFQVSEDLMQTWNGSAWTDSIRTTITYTEEGDNSQYLEQVWNGSAWVNSYREVYTYGASEITMKIENWNTDGSSWENDVLITYEIDQFGYLAVETHEYWNTSSGNYEIGYYDEYDEIGNNPEYYERVWNDTLNKFTDGVRVLSTFYTTEPYDIKQRILQDWDTISLSWVNRQKIDYYWSDFVSVPSVGLDESVKIYPVPFDNLLNVELSEDIARGQLRILDLKGRVVSELKLQPGKSTLDLSYLEKGIYLAEISSGNKKSVIRLTKY